MFGLRGLGFYGLFGGVYSFGGVGLSRASGVYCLGVWVWGGFGFGFRASRFCGFRV